MGKLEVLLPGKLVCIIDGPEDVIIESVTIFMDGSVTYSGLWYANGVPYSRNFYPQQIIPNARHKLRTIGFIDGQNNQSESPKKNEGSNSK